MEGIKYAEWKLHRYPCAQNSNVTINLWGRMSLGFWNESNSVLYNHIDLSRWNVFNWIASKSDNSLDLLPWYYRCDYNIAGWTPNQNHKNPPNFAMPRIVALQSYCLVRCFYTFILMLLWWLKMVLFLLFGKGSQKQFIGHRQKLIESIVVPHHINLTQSGPFPQIIFSLKRNCWH